MNGASAYFDGVGDYLVGTAGAGYDFGTGDFTVEAWVWWDGTYDTAGANHSGRVIYSTATIGASDRLGIFAPSSGSPVVGTAGGIFFSKVTSGVFPNKNCWSHIAGTRSGSTVRIFLNGALVASGTDTSSFGLGAYTSQGAPRIGFDGGSGASAWKGYLSDVRVVKGTAVYTAAFSVPTAPLSAVSGTSLLLNCANASIVDMASTVDIETAGNISSSSAVTKFASKSMWFDGSGDYLSVGTIGQAPFNLGTGDFTIEAWIYPTATITGTPAIYANYGGLRSGAHVLRLVSASGGKLAFYIFPGADIVTSTSNIAIGTWTHVAVARSGGTLRLYVNGILEASAANSTNLTSDTAHAATVGGYWQSASTMEASGYFNGYIEDLRVTKGIGRYSAPSSVGRSLSGSTEIIRVPAGATVAQVLAVVGPSGTNPSARVSITSSSSGTLTSTDPSPNNGVTTSGGVAADGLLASVADNDVTIRIASGGSTNVSVKAAIEANTSVSAILAAYNPSGFAAVTPATSLSGGTDASPGLFSVLVEGTSATVSVPALTSATEIANSLNADGSFSALASATATDSGNASTTGSAQLAGGQD